MNVITRTPLTHHHWHGLLHGDNAADIAARMQAMFDGRRFTYVTGNSYDEHSDKFSAIEVKASQYLKGPVTATVEDGYVHVGWLTQDYSCGITTSARDAASAHGSSQRDWVHLSFDHDRLVIDHYAPIGYRLQWHLVLEDQ